MLKNDAWQEVSFEKKKKKPNVRLYIPAGKTHKPSIKQKVTPIADKMEVSPERILCFHRNLKVFALVKT